MFNQPKKEELKKNIATKKDFSYHKSGCNLNFTLYVDDNKQLLSYKELLTEALNDVKALLGER